MKKFYLTTPIYYPSGKFHIGTAYTTVLADTIKKYKQARGYDARLLTGLDEHGQKIQDVAMQNGKTPQEHVDEIAEGAKKLWALMKIDYDDFIRTTEPRHIELVEKVFDKLMDQGDIYLSEYEGWYCKPCESYFTETQLNAGKCPDCGREVSKMKEEAYFFNMKKYADRLIKFYEENPHFIVPDYRKNELFNNFLKPGLEDLCVSRTSFDWGIKVKKNPKHVVYVWIDALMNYLTSLGYMTDNESLMAKYWPADLQIVGKDIIRFHAIYWPIFLMALDLPLPKQIYAHGWILMKDGKMSKSKGNVIYPEQLIERYGLDSLRYFLLRELPFGQDGVFTPEGYVERFNSDLCNDLGNLLNRTIGMINKYFGGTIDREGILDNKSEIDINLEEETINLIDKVEQEFETYHISNAITTTWELISRTNKYIDETAPWVLAKQEDKSELKSVMYHLIENLRKIAILVKPYINDTSEKIFEQLNISEENKKWDTLRDYEIINSINVTDKPEILFTRLDVNDEVEWIKEIMK